MTATAAAEPLVGRCFTKARRHTLVVGHWPGGGRIWGGPYTVPQIVVAAVAFAVAFLTRGLWAHHGLLDVLPLLGVPYALALVVGRIHVDARSPLAVGVSALGLMAGGRSGRMEGRLVHAGRRRGLSGVCTVTWQPAPGRGTEAVPEVLGAAGGSVPAPVGGRGAPGGAYAAGGRVASGVGALLGARPAGGSIMSERERG